MTLHVLNSACSGFQTNRPSSCCWPPCGLRGHIRDRVKPRARKKVDSSTSCAIYVAVDIILLLLLGSFFRIRAILSLLLFLIKNTMYISLYRKMGLYTNLIILFYHLFWSFQSKRAEPTFFRIKRFMLDENIFVFQIYMAILKHFL